jgi:hypothetical protein
MKKTCLIIFISSLLQACVAEKRLRFETPTQSAGDSMARNSALQMVDPWPDGVDDARLKVPNVRFDKNTTETPTSVTPAPATK